MNDFVDCMTDQSRAQWFVLLKSMGLSDAPRRKKQPVETEVIITTAEAEREMVKVPGFDRSEDGN